MSQEKKNKQKILNHSRVSLFFRELSLLFESGVNLDEALFVMADNAEDKLKKDICSAIADKLADGNTLSQALASCESFPAHAIHMTQVGQASGKLESVFSGLADYYDRQDTLRKSVRSALTYPLVMIAVMFCILSALIIKVLPIFGAVFKETGAQMPLILRLVTESTSFSALLILILLVILVLVVLVFVRTGKDLASGQGSEGFLGRLPFMKGLFKKMEAGNFSYSMALLLSGGIDLETAVNMAGDMSTSSWAKGKIISIRESMSRGQTFSQAVLAADFLEGTFSALLAAGEKAGRTDSMMNLIADKYTIKVSDKINSLLAVIEPTLVIIMSLIVGGILLSIMIPLMNILTSV